MPVAVAGCKCQGAAKLQCRLAFVCWRLRSYPIEIYAGKTLIWSGETERLVHKRLRNFLSEKRNKIAKLFVTLQRQTTKHI